MKAFIASILLVSLALFTGCSSTQKGSIMPGADITTIKKFYVVHLPADNRNINKLIADELNARGYVATTGESGAAPADADALVSYQDRWMWDMAMYMIQLDIQFRKPVGEIPLATGSSMRTSLVRKSPPEMVKEVLDQIFTKAGVKGTAPMGGK